MSLNHLNNKRIAKNTLLLYFRMLFMMLLSLFTSRVILSTLGVEDYGINSVVGGVVSMFGFLSAPMAGATQRYITFALGSGDEKRLRTVFSTAMQIQIILAFIIFLLGESIGLWFFYNVIQIPPDRMDAAFWVLQSSILSSVVIVISVPYNAAIIAHEKMSAYAYISVLEVVLKLIIVYVLVVFSIDKLILYAFLLLAVQLLVRLCYSIFCHIHFKETKYKHVWDKALFTEMIGFAGWGLFGNFSSVMFSQGLNILLNIFFGPMVNAARAVSGQVLSAIQHFVSNFQMALNPQITKMYAQGQMREMHNLMYRSARFSFFMLFFLSLPVLLETNFILSVWLKTVPVHTVTFLRIMICTSLIYTCANPMMIANQATGKIRKYQAVCGTILIMILPISWILLELGFPAYSVFIVHFIMEGVCQFARMLILRPLIGIGIRDYFYNIYFRILIVVIAAVVWPGLVSIFMPEGLLRFFVVGIFCVISVSLSVYLLGLSTNERYFINSKIITLKNKYFQKVMIK